jgi:hypothetical protein
MGAIDDVGWTPVSADTALETTETCAVIEDRIILEIYILLPTA